MRPPDSRLTANALLLRNSISLPASAPPLISHAELTNLVTAAIVDRGGRAGAGDANQEQAVADALAVMPRLGTGLDVNVRFTSVRSFEFTADTAVFDLLSLPLLHGWLVDPADTATAAAVGSLTYNELVERLVSDAPDAQKAALQQFLQDSASQLTPFGLAELHRSVEPSTLAVFFRNNHFCTAYTHAGAFYLLVTDEGYRDQTGLVWERLSAVSGDTSFHTGDFALFTPPSVTPVASGVQEGGVGGLLRLADATSDDASSALIRRLQEEENAQAAQALAAQLERRGGGSNASGSQAAASALPHAGVEATSGQLGGTDPLVVACEVGDLQRLCNALDRGGDINRRDFLGRTALHWAASTGFLAGCEMLLANAAALDRSDDNGHEPLHLAALSSSSNALDIAKLLLDKGANPAKRNIDGKTPLDLASTNHLRQLLQSHPQAIIAAQRAAGMQAAATLAQSRRGDVDMAEAPAKPWWQAVFK